MTVHGHAMRALAEKYLRLAKTSDNPRERSKFIDYAMLYAQLSEQARRRDGATRTAREELARYGHALRRAGARTG